MVGGLTAIFLGLLWLINLLPFPIKLKIGKGIGYLVYLFPSSRRNVTRTNLALCFPRLSPEKREKMTRETFKNFGAGLIETAMAWWDKPEKIHNITTFIGREHLDQALGMGRGVLVIGAHYTTLDLNALLAAKHYEYYAIFRKQRNSVLNWVMKRGRRRSMLGAIPHSSMRTIAKKLMSGHIVWYCPDQDRGSHRSVYAPFFGNSAATLTATARIARMTRAAVVVLAVYRKDDDSGYVVEIIPGPVDYPVEDEVKNATMINTLLEQAIRRAPTQYYWFHRRFKSQPGRDKASIYR